MRPIPGPLALVLALCTGVLLGGLLTMSPALVHATDKTASKTPDAASCTCPESENAKPWPRPKFADASPPGRTMPLDTTDEMAALEAVHMALSELGDGATYVWHRRNGRISGIISPTASFKDVDGRVCRHLTVTLTAGRQSARTEGIACRMADKSWRLDG